MADTEKNRILVIDDDSILRNMLHTLLSYSGYLTPAVNSGHQLPHAAILFS